MYNYQQSETCKLQLDDLRLKVVRMMIIPGYYDPCEQDVLSYVDANGLDIEKVTRDFYEQVGNKFDPSIEAILRSSGIDIPQAYGYKQRVKRLVSLISIVANVYPYSTRSTKSNPGIQSMMYSDLRKDWTREWQEDLSMLNLNLMLLLNQRREALYDLLRRYEEICLKDEIAHQNNSLEQEYDIHRLMGSKFRDIIERFFATVERINQDIVPELNDYSFKYKRYKTHLLDKSFSFNVLVPFILILLFGLVVPLVWAMKPAYTIAKPICTLAIPVIFYILLLISLLR